MGPTAVAAEVDRHPKERLWRRISAAIVVAIAVPACVGAVAGLNYLRFGTFVPWAHPVHIDYCRRSYRGGGEVAGTPESLTERVAGDPTWRTIGHTLTRRPIQGAIQPAESEYSVCTSVLYIPTGEGTYRSYGLVGGP